MPVRKPIIGVPLFAVAIAAISLVALLVVDHGPWSKPQVLPAHMVEYSSTAAAAKAAGATVTPTPPTDPL
jgi:hypothetical protein